MLGRIHSTNIFQILIKGTNDKTSDLIRICQGDTIEIDNRKYFNNVVIHKKYSNLLGCDSIHSTIIEVLEKIEPKVVLIDFCKGDSIYYNDKWHISPTNYIIKKNRVSQCDSFDQVIIEWFPEPDFDLLHTISLTEDEVTTINIGDQNKIQSIQWRPSTYLNCSDCINPEITAKEDITYYLTITDLNGCTYTDSISIKVTKKSSKIWFPTAFSPNHDHVNDVWRPVLNNSNESIEQISIFDRWGSKVFSSHSNEGWDGMVHNKLALPGVYVFYVVWRDENGNLKVSQGDITLVR